MAASKEATTPKSNPFAPSSQTINTTSASQSDRPVTLQHIPELYQPTDTVLAALFLHATPSTHAPTPEPAPSHPFMSALTHAQNRARTANSAAAYKSTLSPTLDAFASLSQSTNAEDFAQLLADSWAADPLVTLRIIWNLRSIHEGKSAREPFYRAYGWLYTKHPKTAVANLRYLVEPCVKRTIKKKPKMEVEDDMEVVTLAEATDDEMETEQVEELTISMPHGYWKDLLNILLLATTDELRPASALSALHVPRIARTGKRCKALPRPRPRGSDEDTDASSEEGPSSAQRAKAARARDQARSTAAKVARFEKHTLWHDTVARKLAKDKPFRALYVTVARLFADALARDLGILREIADEATNADRRIELAFTLSLVGKWAPSLGGSHDRVTNIATPIAELLYAGGHLKLPVSPLEQPLAQDVAHRLRSAYTRWALSPLRRFQQIPEIAMSARKWSKIKYSRVPSKCMQKNKTLFHKHDGERFSQYLRDVAQGKKKISGATLLPHELLHEAIKSADQASHGKALTPAAEVEIQVIEAQWNTMLERVRESGTLDNTLAVCDVSGSMGYLNGSGRVDIPIFPAVALSIILARVSRAPWANHFITFSATPEIVALGAEDGLVTTARKMANSSWGMNTDFNAIFTKLILPMAVENKLKPEDMVKRLFVFSDMQFDNSRARQRTRTEAENADWKTEHRIIKEKFQEAGYEIPEIVYWNLAGSVSKPVTQDEEGVALVSGFSPGMLKIFLEEGTPDVEELKVVTGAEEDGEFEEVTKEKKQLDPVDTMLKALGKESFAGLVVLD